MAEVVERFDGQEITIKQEDGNIVKLKISSVQQLPPLQNPEVVFSGNDLTSLSYIHEPAVLNYLYRRFVLEHEIYTNCGKRIIYNHAKKARKILYTTRFRIANDPRFDSMAGNQGFGTRKFVPGR